MARAYFEFFGHSFSRITFSKRAFIHCFAHKLGQLLADERHVGDSKVKLYFNMVALLVQTLVTTGDVVPISQNPRKLFGPVKSFLVHLYLKTEKFMRLKPLVRREPLFTICE